MVTFFSISVFRERLQALMSAKRGVYAGVDREIIDAFRSATIDEIRNNRDMILLDDPLVVVKLRLPDHKNRRSRKDGYRLIYLTYRNQEKVVFLDIYPKNGPSQQLDTSDNRLLDLIQTYNEESISSELVLHALYAGLL
jgi:mRNA-degrading endonuclease RelE of RelBE toxin-antitoxin system